MGNKFITNRKKTLKHDQINIDAVLRLIKFIFRVYLSRAYATGKLHGCT